MWHRNNHKRLFKTLFTLTMSFSMIGQYCIPMYAQEFEVLTLEDLKERIETIEIQERDETDKVVKVDVILKEEIGISTAVLNVRSGNSVFELTDPEIKYINSNIVYTYTEEFDEGSYSIESLKLAYDGEEFKIDLKDENLTFFVEEEISQLIGIESNFEEEVTISQEAKNVFSGTCGENLTWTLEEDGALTISGKGAMTNYLYTYEVPWYGNMDSIKTVTIQNGVTNVGDYSFNQCFNITSITIPNSVTNIGKNAFYLCSSLESISLPDSVTSIGDNAFAYSGLTSITIPNKITILEDELFHGCIHLINVELPYNLERIEDFAFAYCDSLASIIIPDSVKRVGENAFRSCESLVNVSLSKSITTIEKSTFYYCSSLRSITIPNSVTSIKDGAFSACSGLTSITIPSSVTSIGSGAFNSCKSLTSVTVPKSVTSIGTNAFAYCINLKTAGLIGGGYDYEFGWTESIPSHAFEFCTFLENINIPNSSKSIGDSAFFGCRSLKNITIPNSVTSIEDNAFNYCDELMEIDIPSSVTSLGNAVFSDCKELSNITLRNGLVTIGENAFYYCSSLTNVVIPNSVTSIGNGIFASCYNLKSITIPEGITSIPNEAFCGCKSLTNITIPNNVTNIGNSSFSGCHSLDRITIPSKVTNIGSYAFSECSGLDSITIPSGVKSIAEGLFTNCSISSVSIPEGVTSIGEYAFYNFSNLTSIALPSSVTSIGNHAFYDCSNVTSINIPSNVTSIGGYAFINCSNLTSITIPKGVTSIGYGAFYECRNLESVIIPDSITSIEDSTFFYCSSLTSITIPSGIKSIGSSAFDYCSSLTSVDFPSSVKSIGDYAFGSCSSLTSITIPASVTRIGDFAFINCDKLSTINLYEGSYADQYFGSGYNKVYLIPEYTEPTLSLDKDALNLNKGESYKITATMDPEDATDDKTVTWSSSDESIATVKDGTVTAVKPGKATITAEIGTYSATCKVTVTSKLSSISLNKTTTAIEKGQTETLIVTYNPTDTTDDKTVTWISSNTDVATVKDGVVTAIKPGESTIVAEVGTFTKICIVTVTSKITSIELNKTEVSFHKGDTETLSVMINPDDTTEDKTVTWTSSNPDVVSVENGTITALKGGRATITATVGTHSATCSVIVVNPIISVTLDKESANVFVGSTTTLIATINPEDTPDSKKITWSSSDESIATVSSKGVVTAVKAGTATITATTSNGKTDICTVNVWNKTSNVSSVKNGETGIDVTWKEVPGATKYSIYRKVDGGSWKSLKTGITTTSYTDTTAESGKKYYYSMLATDGTIKSTYSTTGKYVTYLSKPVISSGKNTQKELKITWKAVTGAASYIIYDEAGNKVGTSTTTSFTDTKATVSGTTYNYQVKAKVGSGTYSALSDTKSCMKLAQPTLSSAKNGETGVKFTWKAVNGALKYTVYRKVDGGSWKSLKTGVTETTYTDTSATSGKKYYYSVKAVNGSATSTYNTTGKGVTYLSRPVITKVTKAKTYNSVKFNSVTGAESYIVYSVNDDGKQTKLGTVTATSATSYTYKDTKATKAGTYKYVVKAKVGNSTYSAYSEVVEFIRK